MRRAVLLGLTLAAVTAAPAAAENQVVTGRDSLDWDRPDVVVAPGEKVTWTFPGTDQVHNVASNGGPAEDTGWSSFASPLERPAPDAEYTFQHEGTFGFVCTVHRSTMLGTVTVSKTAVQPVATPVPLSAQPYTNDDTAPVAPEKVTMDRTAPRLASVSVRRVGKAARVRFRVSESSVVVVRLKRAGRTVRTVETEAAGLRGVTVRMRSGRYRVEVRATDIAGNRSALRTARVTIR